MCVCVCVCLYLCVCVCVCVHSCLPVLTGLPAACTEKSLSFAMVVLNDTGNAGDQFMGVFRAVVPWQHMYADPYSKVTELRLSYFFAMRLNGEMLFHPQLPTDSDSFYVFDFSVSGEHVIASLERGLFGDAAAFSSFLQKLSE